MRRRPKDIESGQKNNRLWDLPKYYCSYTLCVLSQINCIIDSAEADTSQPADDVDWIFHVSG